MQERKPVIVRPTAMSLAMVDAAMEWLSVRENKLPPAITEWLPSRALKREAAWSVTKRKK